MDNNVKITSDRKGLATTSLVLGIIGIVILLFPIVKINGSQVPVWNISGLLFQIVGLIFGILGIKSSKRTSAIAGIILCAVGLILFLVLNTLIPGPRIIRQ
jgi:polyferredoxin